VSSGIYRNPKLLAMARECPVCMNCGKSNHDDVVAAHSNQLRDGKGRGLKAHDYRIAYLCYVCHLELDSGNKMSKAERIEFFEEAHRKTIAWLFENNRLEIK
jgi:hypothetical protein